MKTLSGETTLYPRLCSQSLLFDAWKIVKQKGSAGGVDGVSLLQFEERLGTNLAILRYYVPLVAKDDLAYLDKILIGHLCDVVSERYSLIPNKKVLHDALNEISFISPDNVLRAESLREELLQHYSCLKAGSKTKSDGNKEERRRDNGPCDNNAWDIFRSK